MANDRRIGLVPLVKPAIDPRGVILRKYWVRFDNASKFLRTDKTATNKVYTSVKNYDFIESSLNNRNIIGFRNNFSDNSLVWDSISDRNKNLDSVKDINPEEFHTKSANQLLSSYILTTEKIYLDHSVNNLKSAVSKKVSIESDKSGNESGSGESSISESTIKTDLTDNSLSVAYNLSKFLNFMYPNKGKLSKLMYRLVFNKQIFNKLILIRQLYDKSDSELINMMINGLNHEDIDDGWLSYRYMLLYALDRKLFDKTYKAYPLESIDYILNGQYNNLSENDRNVFIYFHNKKIVNKYLNNDNYLYYCIRKDVDYQEVSHFLKNYFKLNIGSLLSIKFNKFDLISLMYMVYNSLINKYIYIPYDSIYHLDNKYLLTVHIITKYIKNMKSFLRNEISDKLSKYKINDNIKCYLNIYNDYDSPDGQYFIKIKPIMIFTKEPESYNYVELDLLNRNNIYNIDNNYIVFNPSKSLFKFTKNSK